MIKHTVYNKINQMLNDCKPCPLNPILLAFYISSMYFYGRFNLDMDDILWNSTEMFCYASQIFLCETLSKPGCNLM